MTAAESKARARIEALTTTQILFQFDLTEKINNEYIPVVRGWLMDELEKRDPEAFDEWLDSEEPTPRKFYS